LRQDINHRQEGLSLHGDGIHKTNQSFSIEEIDGDIYT